MCSSLLWRVFCDIHTRSFSVWTVTAMLVCACVCVPPRFGECFVTYTHTAFWYGQSHLCWCVCQTFRIELSGVCVGIHSSFNECFDAHKYTRTHKHTHTDLHTHTHTDTHTHTHTHTNTHEHANLHIHTHILHT